MYQMLFRRTPLFSPRSRGSNTGSILLIAVVGLVGLMACASLTVDVGQSFVIAGRCQGLADAAALAAAAEAINGQTAAAANRVRSIMDANSSATVPATWNPGDMVFYGPGSTVPGHGLLGPSEEAVTVTVRGILHFTFGRVLGFTTRDIERSATALRTTEGEGGGVFFAIDPDPGSLGIDLSGSRATVKGVAHSNSRVDITGSKHRFTGFVEWVSRFRVTGSGTVLEQGDARTAILPPPVTFTVDQFRPFDYEINGDYNVPGSQTIPPGVYRVHGGVHVSGSSAVMDGVTFIADDQIQFSGSNHRYTAARLGVFAYSLSNDKNGAIHVSGSGPNCVGALYAPDGNVDFSGSDQSYIRTSVIGWTIDVSGSDYTVAPTPNFGQGKYSVRLIK
jgi:hypothetical protein